MVQKAVVYDTHYQSALQMTAQGAPQGDIADQLGAVHDKLAAIHADGDGDSSIYFGSTSALNLEPNELSLGY